VLGLAVPAWAGGSSGADAASLAAYSARASTVASELAGRTARVECADGPRWRQLASEHGFDRELTLALTPLRATDSGLEAVGHSVLSPRTCRLGASFLRHPAERGARLCRRGGRAAELRWGECDVWGEKLVALHVMTHESLHLAGVVDEAKAECFAMQLDALVAVRLGAAPRFARELAWEYWRYYHPTQDRSYRSAECRDGRALDLFPARNGWPTPASYPRDVTREIARAARRG
jgi:hypothetical protein